MSDPGGSVITPVVNVWVPGVPKPQGSKRAYVHRGTGRAVIVEDNEKVRDWRTDVKIYVTEAMIGKDMIVQPAGVIVRMSFILYRPRSLPKTKPTPLATKKPDADKLARAVMDALTGVVYADDSQVIAPYPIKRIAEIGEQPGALIDVSKVEIRWTK